VVLTAANVLATLIRFLLYRAWVFGDRLADASPPAPRAVPAALSTEVSR
jgi:putative flippase GtrA